MGAPSASTWWKMASLRSWRRYRSPVSAHDGSPASSGRSLTKPSLMSSRARRDASRFARCASRSASACACTAMAWSKRRADTRGITSAIVVPRARVLARWTRSGEHEAAMSSSDLGRALLEAAPGDRHARLTSSRPREARSSRCWSARGRVSGRVRSSTTDPCRRTRWPPVSRMRAGSMPRQDMPIEWRANAADRSWSARLHSSASEGASASMRTKMADSRVTAPAQKSCTKKARGVPSSISSDTKAPRSSTMFGCCTPSQGRATIDTSSPVARSEPSTRRRAHTCPSSESTALNSVVGTP
mmetsp:Transcript_8693/g.23934  ORF Transcript_8693/g.23934 Transcript_8693/m.23934 type:complete len:301 (+) Transcript_8693:647-1549(+)